jgi:hypothetical protein
MKKDNLKNSSNSAFLTAETHNKPRTAFHSRVYITLLVGVWMIISLLPGCGQFQQTETTNAVDLEIVNIFLNNLGEERYIINPDDRTLSEEEDHVFRWVITAISEFTDVPYGDYGIRELHLSKTTLGSPTAYELKRHTSQGFRELVAERFYVQLHAVHKASDPELHGVIDLQGPKLLSFWAEGA